MLRRKCSVVAVNLDDIGLVAALTPLIDEASGALEGRIVIQARDPMNLDVETFRFDDRYHNGQSYMLAMTFFQVSTSWAPCRSRCGPWWMDALIMRRRSVSFH